MDCCISHRSALEYWCWASRIEGNIRARREEEQKKSPVWVEFDSLPKDAAATRLTEPHVKKTFALQPTIRAQELRAFAASHDLSLPVHIAVSDQAFRQRKGATTGHLIHVMPKTAEFYPLDGQNHVVSPTLALLQLASGLEPVSWLLLAYEFCGSYTLDDTTPRGFLDRKPLTSKAQLIALANDMAGMKGVKQARKNIKYLLDGAASPKETALALFLILPKKKNGIGSLNPQLNVEISLSEKAQQIYQKDFCRTDIYFPEYHLDIEYDSDLSHSTAEKRADDALRRAALAIEGIEVVSISAQQISTYTGVKATAQMIAQKLGQSAVIDDSDEMKALVAQLFGKHTHPFD